MERKLFELTDQQRRKCGPAPEIPSDEEFQVRWAKTHRGQIRGWGMGKRDWMLRALRMTEEYQSGLWQGRADRARGVEYSEERSDRAHNLGYHTGYTGYESDRRGWDAATRQRFDEEYLN